MHYRYRVIEKLRTWRYLASVREGCHHRLVTYNIPVTGARRINHNLSCPLFVFLTFIIKITNYCITFLNDAKFILEMSQLLTSILDTTSTYE